MNADCNNENWNLSWISFLISSSPFLIRMMRGIISSLLAFFQVVEDTENKPFFRPRITRAKNCVLTLIKLQKYNEIISLPNSKTIS